MLREWPSIVINHHGMAMVIVILDDPSGIDRVRKYALADDREYFVSLDDPIPILVAPQHERNARVVEDDRPKVNISSARKNITARQLIVREAIAVKINDDRRRDRRIWLPCSWGRPPVRWCDVAGRSLRRDEG